MPLYVYFLEPIAPRSRKEPIVPLHLNYLEELSKKGMLVFSGGFSDKSGGLACIKAKSIEEAKDIAISDPFVANEVDRIVFVKEWNGTIRTTALEVLVT